MYSRRGGREHACLENARPAAGKIYCAPGNGNMASITGVPIKADVDAIMEK